MENESNRGVPIYLLFKDFSKVVLSQTMEGTVAAEYREPQDFNLA